jgi:hypothetical protein
MKRKGKKKIYKEKNRSWAANLDFGPAPAPAIPNTLIRMGYVAAHSHRPRTSTPRRALTCDRLIGGPPCVSRAPSLTGWDHPSEPSSPERTPHRRPGRLGEQIRYSPRPQVRFKPQQTCP